MVEQLRKLYQQLSVKQRVFAALAAVLVFGGIAFFVNWNKERQFKPLYTGLAPEDAAAITAKLREGSVEYRVTENGGTILVPERSIPETRLAMAAAGIPRTGRAGFELFDKTNFGQTDFAEQVNYRRALEGELERSVMSIAGVESARIHITFPKDSLFTESKQAAKASVLVTLKSGAKLSALNVDAIGKLVASAVEGLDAEQVSVVDSAGKIFAGTKKYKDDSEAAAADHMIEYRLRMEKALLDKVNATLEPLLGAKRFRAGVAVDCDFSSGEESEETFDPNKTVVLNSQKSEDNMGMTSPAGVPGTPSTLPRPVSRAGPSAGDLSRKTENTSYQASRVVRRMKLPQGSVRRVSVSVLVDQRLRWEVAGGKPKQIFDAPPPEQLKALKDIVSGVAGIDTNRGDVVIVESIPFEATISQVPPDNLIPKPAPPPAAAQTATQPKIPQRLMIIGGAALGGLLLLGILFFLWRRRKSAKAKAKAKKGKDAGKVSVEVGDAIAGGDHAALEDGMTSEEATALREKKEQKALEAAQREMDIQAQEILGAIKLPEVTTKKTEVLRSKIAGEIRKNPEVMAKVLRTWLQEGDEG